MPIGPYRDRVEAGRSLAARLGAYAGRPDVLVLALPRGGVPVAHEVARALGVPLDVFVVRKLGVPGYEELAMGAVATGGVRVLNREVVQQLDIPPHVIERVSEAERRELERRERAYRGGRPAPDVRDRTVILVDDGLATGSTMKAAIEALRQQRPGRIVVAVPTGARETCDAMKPSVDEVVCAITPEPFGGVGRWYEDFSQTTDEEVRSLLAWRPEAASTPPDPGPRSADPPARAPRRAPGSADLREHAHRLNGDPHDYDPLLERIGDARFVLLGEASHGTHEFYQERAEITKRLIEERGFRAVAVEADWPDAWRVNRWVRGRGDDVDANEALAGFRRFPTWMWRNNEVVSFVEWLRGRNDPLPERERAGFYGLDLYSLHGSMRAVLHYLERVDPAAAHRARERYACFEHFGDDAQLYGIMTRTGAGESCERQVVAQLVELQRRAAEYARRDGPVVEDEAFQAQQNARLVRNAEAYYRTLFTAEVSSWNLRDRHMVETLEALVAHLGRHGERAKVVVWAHNSHLGDARATAMGQRGELNVGQLVRERHGDDAVLVGFTTHHGTVTAASNWDAVAERKQVRPAMEGSWERRFHELRMERFLLTWRAGDPARALLGGSRLERAIGVIYRPQTERQSHYFHARLADQFDAVLHFDETRAVEPLEVTGVWEEGEVPETYPFAI